MSHIEQITAFLESIINVQIFGISVPVIFLGFSGIFFTLRMKFINIMLFKHAIDLVRGKYKQKDESHNISSFQALMSTMAGTIGTGSIAGVAVAVAIGGPGTVLWMILFGLFGMTVKCVEVYLGHKYRTTDKYGNIVGGPMYYLKSAMKEIHFPRTGTILANMYAIFGLIAVIGMAGFQANQATSVILGKNQTNIISAGAISTSILITICVGYMLIGGIGRIAKIAEKIIPLKVLVYLASVSCVLYAYSDKIPSAFKLIFEDAFNFSSGFAGFSAIILIGARRALFASEVGQGTSAIVSASANVKYSQQQGIISLLDPFITVCIVCLSTALVVILTGAYTDPRAGQGALMVKNAISSVSPVMGGALTVSVVMFSLTVMMIDSYYFLSFANSVFREKISRTVIITIFCIFLFIAGIVSIQYVIAFADIFVLLMTITNCIGLIMLSGIAAKDFKEYKNLLKENKI